MSPACVGLNRPPMLRSPLVDERNTDAEESDPNTPPADTETTTDDEPIEPPVVDGVVCYLGPDSAYDVCADVAEIPDLPAEYDYPPPLSGSTQYLAPERYLVLGEVDPQLAVAPNFVLEELAQEYKGPYGVVQSHAVARLQELRDELGALVINSGYRNPDYNAGVGGASSSRHMYGDAFDIDPVSATLGQLADACEENGAGFVGVYATHIHCDWRDDPLDASFYPSGRSAVTQTVQPDLAAEIGWRGAVLQAPATGWDEGEPLREWTAFDADGDVIHQAVGETYTPPAEAVEVQVVVGRAVEVSLLVQ